jgi:hypothetical protein
MLQMSDFSVESDQRILLKYQDGSSLRVAVADLSKHLKKEDLAKVKRALRLRRQYFAKMLPPWARVSLVGFGSAALIWLQGGPVADWQRSLVKTVPQSEPAAPGPALPEPSRPITVPRNDKLNPGTNVINESDNTESSKRTKIIVRQLKPVTLERPSPPQAENSGFGSKARKGPLSQ